MLKQEARDTGTQTFHSAVPTNFSQLALLKER